MALTFNLPSQIVVQTSAQWAADNTVYSAKRILVTSDAYYGSTDQRKLKIADGVQTWSNLDYMPIEQVTVNSIGSAINGAASATPNDTDLVMSVESSVAKKNTWTQIKAFLKTYFDTVYKPTFTENTAFNKNFGTGTTNIVEIGSTLGNSLITSTDANGKLQTLDTSTYPSLTELSYVKGLTSAVQTQIDTKASDVKYAAYSNTDSSHTGNTNETYLKGLLVPSLTTNSTLDIFGLLNKTGTAGNITWNLYYNTTNDLTGSPVKISTVTQTASALYGGKFIRTIINKNSLTDNYIYRVTVTSINDFTQNASSMTSLGVDLSGKYLIITATLANSGDTATLSAFQLIHTKP